MIHRNFWHFYSRNKWNPRYFCKYTESESEPAYIPSFFCFVRCLKIEKFHELKHFFVFKNPAFLICIHTIKTECAKPAFCTEKPLSEN
ncbi:MAG: hypothetical protein ACD_78C00453G0001 [uncultured bacterium (gcode 4)]|uniref:Uncharacterized protein n=1 Tax=uncultured bacterium (gcode 4) TaxID=1234023 RepID=K1YVL3_9BACT|nr:MAG: hypothetical protein ACD_78C00453G0001 [uncultured bacterium (gcode 4)]